MPYKDSRAHDVPRKVPTQEVYQRRCPIMFPMNTGAEYRVSILRCEAWDRSMLSTRAHSRAVRTGQDTAHTAGLCAPSYSMYTEQDIVRKSI